MKSAYEILVRPLITERATSLADGKYPQYVFQVHPKANKVEIRQAVEQHYKKPVRKVNTLTQQGKTRRVRLAKGRRAHWKKAIVIMEEGQHIEDLDFTS